MLRWFSGKKEQPEATPASASEDKATAAVTVTPASSDIPVAAAAAAAVSTSDASIGDDFETIEVGVSTQTDEDPVVKDLNTKLALARAQQESEHKVVLIERQKAAELQHRVKELEHALASINSAAVKKQEDLEKQVKEQKEFIDLLGQKGAELNAQLSVETYVRKQTQEELDQLQTGIQSKVVKLEAAATFFESHSETLKATTLQQAEEAARQKREIADLQEKLRNEKLETLQAIAALETVKEDADKTAAYVAQLTAELNAEKARNQSLLQQLEYSNLTRDAYAEACYTGRAALGTLRAELQAVKAGLRQSQDYSELLANGLNDASAQLEAEKAKTSQLTKEVDKTQNEAHAIMAELAEVSAQQAAVQAQNVELIAQLEKAKKEIEREYAVNHRLLAAKLDLAKQQGQLVTAKREVSEQLTKATQFTKQLLKDNLTLSEENAQLRVARKDGAVMKSVGIQVGPTGAGRTTFSSSGLGLYSAGAAGAGLRRRLPEEGRRQQTAVQQDASPVVVSSSRPGFRSGSGS